MKESLPQLKSLAGVSTSPDMAPWNEALLAHREAELSAIMVRTQTDLVSYRSIDAAQDRVNKAWMNLTESRSPDNSASLNAQFPMDIDPADLGPVPLPLPTPTLWNRFVNAFGSKTPATR